MSSSLSVLLRLLLMLAAHSGVWLLAAALQARMRTGSRSTDVVGTFLIHALLVTLIVLACGTAGVLGLASLSAAGIGAMAAGLALGGHRTLRDYGYQGAAACVTAWRAAPVTVTVSAVLLAAIAVRHAANVWVFPVGSMDEADYHLPKLAAWMQTGTLARPDMVEQRAYFPAGMQFSQVWWVGFLRHDVVIEAAGVEWAAMAGGAVYALCHRFGVSTPGALLAAAVFLSLPGVLLNTSTCGNDMAATACVVSMFALLTRPVVFASGATLAAAALFLGTGIKPTVAFAALGPAILAFAAWRSRTAPAEPPRRIALFAVAGLALFAGSYWYLMNRIEFGSFFHPIGATLSGGSQRVGLLEQTVLTGPSLDRLGRNLMALFGPRLFTGPRGWQSALPDQTGWGLVIPLVAVPALAWCLLKRRGWTLPAAAMAASVISTLLLVEHDPWNARFILWLPALFAAAIALRADQQPPALRAAAAALLVGVGAWQLWLTRVPPVFRESPVSVSGPSWRERTFSVVAHANASPEERACIDSRDGVMCITYNYGVYTLAHPDFGRRVEHTSVLDPDRLLSMMQERECRFLLLVNLPASVADFIRPAVLDGRLRLVCPGWLERTGR